MNIPRSLGLSIWPAAALAVGLFALSWGDARAEGQAAGFLTGNDLLPYCRQYAQDRYTDFLAGYCAATVHTMVYAAPQICAPNSSTYAQAVLVVIRYIEQRPARLHEAFRRLAAEALTEAWPCRG